MSQKKDRKEKVPNLVLSLEEIEKAKRLSVGPSSRKPSWVGYILYRLPIEIQTICQNPSILRRGSSSQEKSLRSSQVISRNHAKGLNRNHAKGLNMTS